MSEDATISFGYDGAQLDRGMMESERKIIRFASRAESSMHSASGKAQQFERSISKVGGGGAMRNMGNVSMQIQDIAVQMQSGTRASIIFAQQGSQMLSAFGPAGAVAGAVAAIAGGMFLAKEKAEEAFNSAIKRASEFRVESARMVRGSNLDNLADGFKRVRDEVENLNEAEKAFVANVPFYTSNKKREESRSAFNEQRTQVSATSSQMLRQVLDLSEQEVEISDMIVAGNEKEAAALVRKRDLEKQILEIGELKITESSKAQLISDATRKAANTESLIQRESAKQEREKRQNYQRELDAKREGIKLAQDGVAIMELEMEGRTEEATMLKEKDFITKRAREHSNGGLDAAASIALAAREWQVLLAQQRRAEADKAKAQKAEMSNKKDTLDMERKSVELLEAEAKGQTKKIAHLKEQAYITQRMKELSGLGISPAEAESIARRELKAKKEKERYDETGRAHIGGVKKKTMMGSTFHGLDEFERLQEKDYEPEGRPPPGYRKGQPVPRYKAFGRDSVPLTSAQRTGRYMGGDNAGTRGHAAAEVINNSKKNPGGSDVAEEIKKSNSLLSDIKEGLV